jgi:hypothetical protein
VRDGESFFSLFAGRSKDPDRKDRRNEKGGQGQYDGIGTLGREKENARV